MTSIHRHWKAAEEAVAAALQIAEGHLEGTLDRGAGPASVRMEVERLPKEQFVTLNGFDRGRALQVGDEVKILVRG